MDYKVEKDILSKKWLAIESNKSFKYQVIREFDSEEDAKLHINNQIIKNNEFMQNVVSIKDYFGIGK